jgi:hypothetical protein
MIAPTDAIDIIERILKSYRHDDILDKDPDPICALMDMHSILENTENGLDETCPMHLSNTEQEKGK